MAKANRVVQMEAVKRRIEYGDGVVACTGMTDAFAALLLSGLGNKKILAVTESEAQAKKMAEDIKAFTDASVFFLPGREINFYDAYAHSRETESERVRVLCELAGQDAAIVTTAVDNLLIPFRRPSDLKNSIRLLEWGGICPVEDLLEFLADTGYESVDQVQAMGQYSRRGGILDVFSPGMDKPLRMEFFGDEIDSIRIFDASTQVSVEKVGKANIFPAREFALGSDAADLAQKAVRRELGELGGNVSDKAIMKYEEVLEGLSEGTVSGEAFNLSCYMPHGKLLSYFDSDSIIVFSDEKRISQRAVFYREDFLERFKMHLEKGKVLSGQHVLVGDYELLEFPGVKLFFDRVIRSRDRATDSIDFAVKPQTGFKGRLDALIGHIEASKEKGLRTVMYTGGSEKASRLKAELFNRGIVARRFDGDISTIGKNETVVSGRCISEGFVYENGGLDVFSEADIFGVEKKHRRNVPAVKKRAIRSFTDLKPGDFVVHENHGIGRFVGIKQLEVEKVKKDYLQLAYKKGDYLYVPVNQMDLIQKYLGSDSSSPKLNGLGGLEWQKTKQRAKRSIEDLTDGLLELYAKRETATGHAFMPDTNWQNEFEDIFEYDETPDQIKVIDEIKIDMMKPKPMDRLLCGDVGYGKTEVALRAAFKAINDGKQVAILVPTTILAQQHYNTAQKRMGTFPVSVEMLSRFRSKARQEKIAENLKQGRIDLIVGTHRLLSKDIEFKDLGLLIIDEEQRFGVKHKEKLKKLKSGIDVLSLSATPIPRTLHMSLVGIRDISVIEDPPEERFPVETFVVERDDEIIREAITKEISRGGQVYFVHNKIRDIDRVAGKVAELSQGAKVAYAHGQMNERKLEDIMIDFLNGDIDVLVCTTIIETGLDIPNVNTILIDDSDHMGLSQLYQLRGRVGRSNKVARAYLMYQKNKIVSSVAEERLKAIREFTELGSGFKIAMRDLEIRGTGNLLGPQQHGQMEAVGYDLYVKMMEDAIMRIKGEKTVETVDTAIEIKVSAYIPEEYISNEVLKLETYKRISTIGTKKDYFEMQEEIEDRFGTPPEEVYNLLDVSYLKALANRIGVSEIRENDVFYRFEIPAFDPETASMVMDRYKSRVHLHAAEIPSLIYRFKGSAKNPESKLKEAISFMEEINSFKESRIKI